MNVDILCPQCGTLFTVRRDLLGKRTKCTRCGTGFVIAEAAATGAAPAVGPAPPASGFSPVIGPTPTAGVGQVGSTAPVPPLAFPEFVPPQAQDTFLPPIGGHPIGVPPVQPAAGGGAPSFPASPPHAGDRGALRPRFQFVRLMARMYEVLAILALCMAAAQFIMMIVNAMRTPERALATIFASGFLIFWTAAAVVTFLFVAQMIRLILQVEQNTRTTSEACQRLADHLCSIEHER